MTVTNQPTSPGAIAARKIRDGLLMDHKLIEHTVNECINAMAPHRAEHFRVAFAESPALRAAIGTASINLGLVLALAKGYEKDEDYFAACELMHEIPVKAHDGLIGEFANVMVECDIAALKAPDAESKLLYDLATSQVQLRRLDLVKAFIAQKLA